MRTLFLATGATLALAMSATMAHAQVLSPGHGQSLSQIRESDWHPFSRSGALIYLADAGLAAEAGGVTTIQVAKVPRNEPGEGQPAYRIETYEYRCASGEARSILISERDASGQETDRYDEGDAPWEAVPQEGFLRYLWTVACDGHRNAAGSWPSIQAFIAAGKPGGM